MTKKEQDELKILFYGDYPTLRNIAGNDTYFKEHPQLLNEVRSVLKELGRYRKIKNLIAETLRIGGYNF